MPCAGPWGDAAWSCTSSWMSAEESCSSCSPPCPDEDVSATVLSLYVTSQLPFQQQRKAQCSCTASGERGIKALPSQKPADANGHFTSFIRTFSSLPASPSEGVNLMLCCSDQAIPHPQNHLCTTACLFLLSILSLASTRTQVWKKR